MARAGTWPINNWYSPIVRSYSVLWQKLLNKVRVAVLLVAAFFFRINFSLVCLLKTSLNGWFQFFSLNVSVACWGLCGHSPKAREIRSRWMAAHVTLFSLAWIATLRRCDALLYDANVNCSVKSGRILLAFLLQFLSDSDCKTLSLYFLKFVTPSSFKLFLFSVIIKLLFYCLSFCFRIINNFSKRINGWSSVTVVCSDKTNTENIVK